MCTGVDVLVSFIATAGSRGVKPRTSRVLSMCPSSAFVPRRLREPACPRLCPAVSAVAHAAQIIVAPATHDAGSVPAVHDSVLAVVTRPQLAAPADTAGNRVSAGEVE